VRRRPDFGYNSSVSGSRDDLGAGGRRPEPAVSDPQAKGTGRLALVIVGVVIVAVIVSIALHGWRIDRPDVAQIVVCIALLAGAVLLFWTWCVSMGRQLGSTAAATTGKAHTSASRRRQIEKRADEARQRARRIQTYFPLAGAAAVTGLLVLML
jgi:hypothetical protein